GGHHHGRPAPPEEGLGPGHGVGHRHRVHRRPQDGDPGRDAILAGTRGRTRRQAIRWPPRRLLARRPHAAAPLAAASAYRAVARARWASRAAPAATVGPHAARWCQRAATAAATLSVASGPSRPGTKNGSWGNPSSTTWPASLGSSPKATKG